MTEVQSSPPHGGEPMDPLSVCPEPGPQQCEVSTATAAAEGDALRTGMKYFVSIKQAISPADQLSRQSTPMLMNGLLLQLRLIQ